MCRIRYKISSSERCFCSFWSIRAATFTAQELDVRVLFFHRFKELPVLAVDHRVIQRALHHVVHVGHEAIIVEAVPVHRDMQFLLHDVRGLLDDGTIVDIWYRLCLRPVIDKMQSDGCSFFPWEGDPQTDFSGYPAPVFRSRIRWGKAAAPHRTAAAGC